MKPTRVISRRTALNVGGALGATALLRGQSQQDPFRDHSRVPRIEELASVQEFEAVAFARMLPINYAFMGHGGEGEFTMRRNIHAFDWAELVPKGVVDVSSVQTATQVFNTKAAYPIFVSPTSFHIQLNRDAEAATYRGATAASNTPYIVSHAATLPKDKIAAASNGPLWFQFYPQKSMDATKQWVDQADAARAEAVVVTVDQQATFYERAGHMRNLNVAPGAQPPRPKRADKGAAAYGVPDGRLWYNWKYTEDLKKLLRVPMVIKGILTGEDAKAALDHGFDGIYVSNHGGRTMDYTPSTIEVLEEVVDAVGGRVPVLFDSGVRNGSDILKALALGAKAVCIGRGCRWGLAAYGAPGVQRVLEILQAELVMAMARTGRPTLASIDRSLVRTDFT